MNITLPPETAEQVRRLVESGQFEDADDVVSRALELLTNEQKPKRVKELIAEGEASYARGEFVEVTEGFMQDALERARERSRLGLPIPDHVKP